MTPEQYDHWYASGRGRWIGETEFRLLASELDCQQGDKVLDVGCGTGWFTRRIAGLPQSPSVTGVDVDNEALAYARSQDSRTCYLPANALQLPFADGSFDRVMSVTALCFVPEWSQALSEIVRVTRGRFVLGLLNRHSLLWRQKGRGSHQGAYKGAHWHTRGELLDALDSLAVRNIRFRTAIWLPGGGLVSRTLEACLPHRCPLGGFLLVAGDKA
ncbi:class I SAM-dependent methyltransferase [Marinobacter sp. HL-58]|uniref:class I SAM-dependent methyltransferase n=1 Tax=Marinobacter sp. HL-58 TaxID=1479237 RepID=UPI0004802330|nr:class I SAM-dependent methyltransferase [Marinobacter sp. HL-58]KPP98983.1 MAG: Methylase involved in ubiquinone/menaquinone biosynthesis [Marinobacter sp. HL-58]